jgi:hypothetical protein
VIRLRTSISRPVPDLVIGEGVISVFVTSEGIVAVSARPAGTLPMDGGAAFGSVMGEFGSLCQAIVVGDGSALSYATSGEEGDIEGLLRVPEPGPVVPELRGEILVVLWGLRGISRASMSGTSLARGSFFFSFL